jgi:hypothetical protein
MSSWFLRGAHLVGTTHWASIRTINQHGGPAGGMDGWSGGDEDSYSFGESEDWETNTEGEGWPEFEDDHVRDRSVEITVR